MIEIRGLSNETVVLDGEWFEKLRGGTSKTRLPAASFVSAEVKEIDRRKKLFGGDREQLIQVTLTFDRPPFVGLMTPATNREKVDALLAGLAAARDSTQRPMQ
ncbi:hypothetical protein [Williamsia muralis]|jgi:hypothetical protein|uniref:PH (Pleckstrin Homology) domain-containing protein n=1 Tax=Williamsia marianensis TaxID=85044 RepID=A0A315SAR4_WILMA|nr:MULTISPECIES: hypothetical protein [Williamsia]MDV7134235.1 hypothetical protein [Williamsia muralis]PVY31502.1 hypothetical protein C7458_103319 [Williamsia marianensis]RKR96306.1 hypothetical protein DFJ75_3151 [Williamsia muralis]